MAFTAKYRFCSGDTPPVTECVLVRDCQQIDEAEDITICPSTVTEGSTWISFNENGDSLAEFDLDRGELLSLIAELQRALHGCFKGEWPRPVAGASSNAWPSAALFVPRDAELERRTNERDAAAAKRAEIDAQRKTLWEITGTAVDVRIDETFDGPPTATITLALQS